MKKKRIVRTIQRIVALFLLFSMFPVANYVLAEDAVTGSTAGGTKTVTDNGDGTYQVQLTLNGAYAEEQTVTPTDFIFVCDVSGSMNDSISSSDLTKRFTALVNALNSAVDIIFKDEDTSTSGTQTQNRVSFVTFSSIGSDYTKYQKVYPSIGDGYYNSLSSAKSAISTINNTGALGGTNYCLGLDKAGQKAAESGEDRNVVMIFLTDGQVSNYSTMNYRRDGWYWGQGGTGQPDTPNLNDCIIGTNKYVDGGVYEYKGWWGTYTKTWDGWNPTYSKYFDARYCVALGFDPASISSNLSSCITNFCPDGIKKADSEKELESIFNTIATNPFPMRNVTIQDTLTSDVEFTTTATSGFTVQIENGTYDEQGNPVWNGTQISPVDSAQIDSISISDRTVKLVMKQDSDSATGFTLLDTQRLILTFNVQPSDSVYTKAFEDPTVTTFNTNVTDEDVSNPNSSYGSGDWESNKIYAVYPSGTITIPTTKLILNKIDQVGQPVAGAEFTVVRNGTDSISQSRVFTSSTDGTVTINGLTQGEYTLSETKVPDGYKDDKITYRFSVSKDDNGNLEISGLDELTKTDSGYQVTNYKNPTITIKKVVEGTGANKADEFSFTVKQEEIPLGTANLKDGMTSGEIVVNYGSDITISEDDLKGYTATATIGENEDSQVLEVTEGSVELSNVTQDTLIVFTNTKNAPVVTGFVSENSGMTGIALVSVTLVGLGVIAVYLKKRHV